MSLPEPPVREVRTHREALDLMAGEVRAGLLAQHRSIPSKYFYDDAGSRLFEEITQLPEYYQTRTETALLRRVADEIVTSARAAELVELGAGTSPKVRLLLDAMLEAGGTACTLLDVHAPSLEESLRGLRPRDPGIELSALAGDFSRDRHLRGGAPGRLVALLGSTLGNLQPPESARFLEKVADVLLPGGCVLLGLDLVKDVGRLEAAYNDAQGVTAAFNRNILQVVNQRLEGDFDPAAFDHIAFYDVQNAWIEMRLRARRAQKVSIRAIDVRLELAEGEEIRTEVSCKYTRTSLRALLPRGLELFGWYEDPDRLFALALLRRVV